MMRRAGKRTDRELSSRAKMLASVLNDDWVQSRTLVDQMKARYRRHAGRQLKRAALEQAVLRAADELVRVGFAEQKIARAPGVARTLCLRRLTPPPLVERGDFVVTTCRDDISVSPH